MNELPEGFVIEASPPPAVPALPEGFVIEQSPSTAGFAPRADREGTQTDIRNSEYLADALRSRLQNPVSGAIDAVGRGFAGWIPGMDKIAAGGDALFGKGDGGSFGERYADNLARERAIDDADRLVNPNTRLTGQAAGLLGTAAILPNVTVTQGIGRGAQAANAAATGATYAGITGAVENDGGVFDKAKAGLTSAAVGGAIGAVAPSAVDLIGRGISGVGAGINAATSPITSTVKGVLNPAAEAEKRLVKAYLRDGVDDPALALAKMQEAGAPAVAGDVGGETVRALARSAANQSPEAREALTDAVTDRFASQGDRVISSLRGSGVSSGADALEALQSAAQRANSAAYKTAEIEAEKIGGMWTDRLSQLAQAPATQEAFKDAIRNGGNKVAANGMTPIRTPFGVDDAGNLILKRQKDGSVAVPNLAFWDATQRSLRDMTENAMRNGKKELAKDIGALRREILKEVDGLVPAFNEARTGAARFFQAEDALEAGQKFVTSRMENAEALKALGKMKPAERELFAEGFRETLIARIREVGDNRDIVKAIFNSPAERERVRIALGPQKASELEATLKIEAAMNALKNAFGNSTTTRQLVELGLAGGAGAGIGYYNTGSSTGAVAGAMAGAALRKGSGYAEGKVAKQIGEILASGDPKRIEAIAKAAAKSKATMDVIDSITDAVAANIPKAIGDTSAVVGDKLAGSIAGARVPLLSGPRASSAETSNGQTQPEEQNSPR